MSDSVNEAQDKINAIAEAEEREYHAEKEASKVEPKRIKRMRALAAKGLFASATIEKVKINGGYAGMFILFYDASPDEVKAKCENFPILNILSHIKKLEEKGVFKYKFV